MMKQFKKQNFQIQAAYKEMKTKVIKEIIALNKEILAIQDKSPGLRLTIQNL
jgi:NAD+--asparagine ADP-ribosyltransferase